MYYDGYGYNFYNGNYGYYEYSRPPINEKITPFVVQEFLIVFACFIGLLGLYVIFYYRNLKKEMRLRKS